MKKVIPLLMIGFITASCGGNQQDSNNDSDKNNDATKITGAGATFPYPLYDKMMREYRKESNLKINYQSIGSGGGVRQIKNKTVDFGASDAFLDEKEMASIGDEIVHVPTCLGSVVMAYNLKGVDNLKLTSDVIAGIAMGKIKQWDNEKIQALNPDKDLPDQSIVFVYRSDGSGTTFVFTDYLYKTNKAWKEKVGRGKSVQWPTGIGGKGNEGVSGYVQQQQGRVGYVELSYAKENDALKIAKVKNQAGNFIKPTVETTSNAAKMDIPDDTRITVTNSEAENAYPIASFTWLLLYKEQSYNNRSKAKVKKMLDLMWWMIHDGQHYAEPLHYAPLAEPAVKKAEEQLKSITFEGEPILNEQR